MAIATSSANPDGTRHRDTPSCILLDLQGYIADCSNATTAWSKTSTGVPISVSFCIARPPFLSHLFVYSPGLDLAAVSLAPKVLSSDGDLVLLRVPLHPYARWNKCHSDYFVYRMRPQRRPKLGLLPNPSPARFVDDEIAILSCGDDGFVVAGLKILLSRKTTFELHLYRYTAGKRSPGRWTSQMVSVEDPVRDRVCPMPDSSERVLYHITSKTITIGGEKGTVWVDLWRGILLCDVLSESPKLRDIPLPLPARSNWSDFLNGCLYFSRDITVSGRRDTIKYVEMEITPPDLVPITPSRPEPASYYEWVKSQECPQPQPQSYSLVPGDWTATTYSMPIPVGSWDDWRRDSSIRLGDLKLTAENTRSYESLCELVNRSGNKEPKKATLSSLRYVSMAYPTIVDDGDGDTVYLVSKGTCRGSIRAMVSVDVWASALQGVAKLEAETHAGFKRCCLASKISKQLKT